MAGSELIACCTAQAVFAGVYELDVDEDINKVLFALPQPVCLPAAAAQSQFNRRTNKKSQVKKSQVATAGQLGRQADINGSPANVKLLASSLRSIVQDVSLHSRAELEAMLNNLSLAKR